MKISKEQKEQTKRSIIEAAVDLIIELGFEKATMRKIARQAGVGDATIYKYFSTKEKILLAYYEVKAQDTIKELEEISDFDEYDLQEKVQTLVETYLDKIIGDREFVQESIKMILYTPIFLFKDVAPVKKEFNTVVKTFLDSAVEKGELEEFPFMNMIPDFASEYVMAILLYWTQDESDEFSDTTQLIDLTLSLGILVLKSGIINKGTEMLGFFAKSYMFRSVSGSDNILSKLQKLKAFM